MPAIEDHTLTSNDLIDLVGKNKACFTMVITGSIETSSGSLTHHTYTFGPYAVAWADGSYSAAQQQHITWDFTKDS